MAVEKLPGLSFLFHQMKTIGSTQQAVVRIKGDNADSTSLSPDQSSLYNEDYTELQKTLTD